MKFLEILKKLFNPKDLKSVALVNISDLINLPDRSQLSDKEIIKLEKYKSEYLNIMSSNKVFVSKSLNVKDLYEEMNMNIELLFNLCLGEDREFIIDSLKSSETLEDNVIKRLKLSIYEGDIHNLRVTVMLRVMALCEILDSEKRISLRLKNSICNEINNLSSALLVFTNQEKAVLLEKETYFNSIVDFKDNVMDLNKRKYKLLEIMSIFMPEDFKNFELGFATADDKLVIAFMEAKIEKYVYKHKNDVLLFDKELEFFKERVSLNENYDLILINILELKYQTFAHFGRNTLSTEQLDNFYKFKFSVITKNIVTDSSFNILDNLSSYELYCYQDIVMQKIEDVILGNNQVFNHTFAYNMQDAILYFKDIMKNGGIDFNPYQILSERRILAFLLAFDRSEGLKDFFEKFMVDKNIVPDDIFPKDVFVFNNQVPLETIIILARLNNYNGISMNKIYDLYSKRYYRPYEYKLFEGINSIRYDSPFADHFTHRTKLFLDNLNRKMANKVIVMPSSLRSINYNIFSSASGIRLNDGLEVIGDNVLDDIKKLKYLALPASVKTFHYSESLDLDSITFLDVRNSKLLNDKDSLRNLIGEMFYLFDTGKREHYYASEDSKRRQQLYSEGRYSSSDHSYLYDRDTKYIVFNLKCRLKQLIFYVDHNPCIVIDRSSIDLFVKKDILYCRYSYNSKFVNDQKLSLVEIDEVIDIIDKKIREQLSLYDKEGLIKKLKK